MTTGPAVPIDPPRPAGWRFGLYSVASQPDGPARWPAGGVTWVPDVGAPADVRAISCDLDDPPALLQGCRDDVYSVPFMVVGSSTGLPIGVDHVEQARRHLAAGEERAVERAIVEGLTAGPSFQGADVLTARGIVEAVGLLEQWQGERLDGPGVLHVPLTLAARLKHAALVERAGGRLETAVGTAVAAGAGYGMADPGPAGVPTPAGQAWIVGTSQVQVRRGPVEVVPDVTSTVDRESNVAAVLAWRPVTVTFGPDVAAVLVPTSDCAECEVVDGG